MIESRVHLGPGLLRLTIVDLNSHTTILAVPAVYWVEADLIVSFKCHMCKQSAKRVLWRLHRPSSLGLQTC
jgi:hypothetical protein